MNMYPKSNNHWFAIVIIFALVSSGILLGITGNFKIIATAQSSLTAVSSGIKSYRDFYLPFLESILQTSFSSPDNKSGNFFFSNQTSSNSLNFSVNSQNYLPEQGFYSWYRNCPVIVNNSDFYYQGGNVSVQNTSPDLYQNVSVKILLPQGVKVLAVKGLEFEQIGNSLELYIPSIKPYSNVVTSYKHEYKGHSAVGTSVSCG